MRKLLAVVTLLVVGNSALAEQQPQLFDCMDKKSFALDSQCLEQQIGQNLALKDQQMQITQRASVPGDYVMATMTFHPERFLIEIVAHRDALIDKDLSAYQR